MKSTLYQFLYTACHQRDEANGRRKITVEKFTLIGIGNEQIKTAHRLILMDRTGSNPLISV